MLSTRETDYVQDLRARAAEIMHSLTTFTQAKPQAKRLINLVQRLGYKLNNR
jgi:hypothetical protein